MPERLSAELLAKFRALVYNRYGIYYTEEKTEVLGIKLKKLAVSRDYSLMEYYERLVLGDEAASDELLREITVGHTFFFRENTHLSCLVSDIKTRRTIRPVIWCAASSTGEEPYSIVIFLLERGVTDFLVVASDVNVRALEAMNRGVYHENQFQSTPKEVFRKYFLRHGECSWRVRPELRRYIMIKRINLHDNPLFERSFDYIFCRNVMIYFDDVGRRKVLGALVENLRIGGLLFVGHAEAMLALPHGLRKESSSVFRKTV